MPGTIILKLFPQDSLTIFISSDEHTTPDKPDSLASFARLDTRFLVEISIPIILRSSLSKLVKMVTAIKLVSGEL